MKKHLTIFLFLIGSGFGIAEVQGVEDTWYIGEGLKKGDAFSYTLCHWNFNDCQEFQMSIWIDGEMTLGDEPRWTAQAMVLDEDKTLRGEIEFAKEAAEPFGRHHELKQYRDAFKDSAALLASYTSEKVPGSIVPGDFVDEEQWIPSGIVPHKFEVLESDMIDVQAGSFDAVILQSKTNPQNKLWIVDEFPFPIKAEFYLDRVCYSGCPLEYKFELLNYSKNTKYGSFIEMAGRPHSEYLSPLKQFKNDTPFHETKCNKNMQLTQKYDGSPACVNPETYFELIKRGWVSNIILAIQSRELYVDPADALSSYMDKITPTLDDFKNVLSEPYDIDEILSKFGEPHDDIGSGIHTYVYDLNDLTEIWIGYADDILYVRHVDTDGNKLDDLFVKETETKTASEDNFDISEVKLFLAKYTQAEIIVDHVEYRIHQKHYKYADMHTEDSVNLVLTKHVATENINSILSCHLDQNHNMTYGMRGSEKIIEYLQNHDCLSESNMGNLEPLTIRESFLELGFGDEEITVFITDMANRSPISMNLFTASQEWGVIPISNLVGAHNRLPETSSDDRRGPGTIVSDTVKAGTYIKQNDEKEFWYTIGGIESQVITIELHNHEYDRIVFVSDKNEKLIEQINEIVDSRK